MSFQFGNRCTGGPALPPPQQGYGSGYAQFQSGRPGYGAGSPQQSQQMTGYGSSPQQPYSYYGRNPNQYQNQNQYTSRTSQYAGVYGGQGQGQPQVPQQTHQRIAPPQESSQMPSSSPRVSFISPGQQVDPNMKVIKLNWGDLLGTGSPEGTHNLNVAMLGPQGDLQRNQPGLRVTFNGEVPQGLPCHVMNINPYGNMLGGAK